MHGHPKTQAITGIMAACMCTASLAVHVPGPPRKEDLVKLRTKCFWLELLIG